MLERLSRMMIKGTMTVHNRVLKHLLLSLSLVSFCACEPTSDAQNDQDGQFAATASPFTSSSPLQVLVSAKVGSKGGPVFRTPKGARVTHLSDSARLMTPQGEVALSLSHVMQPGHLIHTGPKTRLELRFADGSIVRVGPGTKIRMLHHSEDQDALFQVLQGDVWCNIRPSKHKMIFHTKYSTVSILGTIIDLRVSAKQTSLHVIRGKVSIRQAFNYRFDQIEHAEAVIANAPERKPDNQASDLPKARPGLIQLPDQGWLELESQHHLETHNESQAQVKVFSAQSHAAHPWSQWNLKLDQQLPPH